MIPLGFEEKLESQTISKLNQFLYSLKQSLYAWFDHFSKVIKKHGYIQGQTDHTMFANTSKVRR